MGSSELEALLNKHRGEGAFDSTGVFTLDLAKRSQQYTAALLADPYLYILKLVQWAVAAHASKIKIELGPRKVLFAHDGYPPKKDWLIDWEKNFEPNNPESVGTFGELRDLAIALHALKTLEPISISILYRGLHGSLDFVFDREEDRFREKSETTEGHLNVVSIKGRTLRVGCPLAQAQYQHFESGGFSFKRLFSALEWAEKSLLKSCCPHCPIPIQVNGVYINQPFFGLASSSSKQIDRLNFNLSGLQGHRDKAFLYRLVKEERPQLLAPSVHPAAAMSAWYFAGQDHPVAEIFDDRRKVVRPTHSYTPEAGFQIENAVPVNSDTQLVQDLEGKKKLARVTSVVRGVSVETLKEPWLPNDVYILQSNYGLKVDLAGLRIVRDKKAEEGLAYLARFVR